MKEYDKIPDNVLERYFDLLENYKKLNAELGEVKHELSYQLSQLEYYKARMEDYMETAFIPWPLVGGKECLSHVEKIGALPDPYQTAEILYRRDGWDFANTDLVRPHYDWKLFRENYNNQTVKNHGEPSL